MQIYLDHSATTPPCPDALAAMGATLEHHWGNPASLHHWGQRAALVMETARQQVATLIDAAASNLVFTSGGTESNHLAILGVTQGYAQPQHLIISAVEHGAVGEPVAWLERQGWQVTRLPVDGRGRVNPQDLRQGIRPNTVLISVIYGQSEVGTLQPIGALGAIAREAGIPFHTDAVQVVGRLPVQVSQLPVDLLSLSSHKLYGPQGAGALYVRSGLNLQPVARGGGQEGGLRSGTPGVPAIAGFGAAAAWVGQDLPQEQERLTHLRDRLFEQLADVPSLEPTGDRHHRLPHHVSYCWHSPDPTRLTGKTLVHHLNLAGLGISAGSACHSGKTQPSPVLMAMGYGRDQALGGIRLTLGRHTTPQDVDWVALVLKQVIRRLV
jgi:cysteine desulfurase